MNPVDEKAIEEFLKEGRQVQKVPDHVPATAHEVIAYLAGCGIQARYHPGDQRAYLCGNKRVSEQWLIALANRHRLTQGLPPIALRS